jgi:hypothetical protein
MNQTTKRKAPSGRAVLTRTTRKDKHRKYRPISEMRKGTYKVRNEIETKRNEINENETKRNETKRNEINKNETKRNEINETKRNQRKEISFFSNSLFRFVFYFFPSIILPFSSYQSISFCFS